MYVRSAHLMTFDIRRSTHLLIAIRYSVSSPPSSTTKRNHDWSHSASPRGRVSTNDAISEATIDASPAFPASIRIMMIRRRTGWLTTCSDSELVNPEVVNALRAWNRARCSESPVCTSATVATRTTTSEQTMTVSSDRMASMGAEHTAGRIGRRRAWSGVSDPGPGGVGGTGGLRDECRRLDSLVGRSCTSVATRLLTHRAAGPGSLTRWSYASSRDAGGHSPADGLETVNDVNGR